MPPSISQPRKILVTSALPYVNGSLHAGHLLEHTQTDIWARFQRLRGHQCTYISAADGHGTTTMLEAEKRGVAPEDLLKTVRAEHIKDFQRFHISHDCYYSTHSPENRTLSELIYTRCRDNGRIQSREVEQLFDEQAGLFLADRYVRGTCPKCGAPEQSGDNCEQCGTTYDATELTDPISSLSGATPILKSSTHYFFDLPYFADFLRDWTRSGSLHKSIISKLDEWLSGGLTQWDISRDAPYFGFRIPDTDNKYFYVWLDAPIGYMSSFQHYASGQESLDFDSYWDQQAAEAEGTEIHHFIGKDIIYFHALFWPALLKCAGFQCPTRIHTHGFLTLNQHKLSKSRGVSLDLNAWLKHCDAEHIRYYFATRLAPGVDDIDMNLEDFAKKVNTDLVGKVVNIASRCAKFINQDFNHLLSDTLADADAFNEAVLVGEQIAAHYEGDNFSQAVREIMALADRANEYIQAKAPWSLMKSDIAGSTDEAQQICSQGLNLFRLLIIYLKPITPMMAERAEDFLNIPPLEWAHLDQPLLGHEVKSFRPLLGRIDTATMLTELNVDQVTDG